MDGAMFQNARRLSQAVLPATTLQTNLLAFWNMAPSMKATTKAMTKGALADALATGTEVKKSQCTKLLDSLAKIATAEVKKAGLFTVPGLCRIKTRTKPATKAGKREIFGKMQIVKAKPARTIVKAFPVSALKNSI